MQARGDERKEAAQRRLVAFRVLLALILLALLTRSAYLQVVRGAQFEQLARGNALRLLPLPAPRGRIFDRHHELMVGNRPAYHVSLVHPGPGKVDEVIARLAPLLEMEVDEIREAIRRRADRLYEPVRLKLDVDPVTHSRVEENRGELPGVVVEVAPVRDYPGGSLAAHLLGYVGEIDALELARLEGYRQGDIIGKMGLEAAYDAELRGRDGGRQVETDANNRPVRVLGQVDPIPGNTLVLTIDAELQRVAEAALQATLAAVRAHPRTPYRATSGAVVVLKVNTGEVLVMASHPGFDPNQFASRTPRSYLDALRADPLSPFLNRVISGLYVPGSTFKMITAIAALEAGKVTLGETLVCTGTYRVTADHSKRCWRSEGHGAVNIFDAISHSCNVFFFEMGRRVGVDLLAYYARAFGLGQPTGIDLRPLEKAGTVPDREWKRSRFPRDPTFWLAEELDAAIGQGFHEYTPLQLAHYVATIASGGIRYQPYLVSRVVDPSGRIVRESGPRVIGEAPVSSPTLAVIREGMRRTTVSGTAAWLFGPRFKDRYGFEVAGKTGTAEAPKGSGRDPNAWFLAFAPLDDPEIAIAVLVEEGGSGSLAAAPVARALIDHYFGLVAGRRSPEDAPAEPGD